MPAEWGQVWGLGTGADRGAGGQVRGAWVGGRKGLDGGRTGVGWGGGGRAAAGEPERGVGRMTGPLGSPAAAPPGADGHSRCASSARLSASGFDKPVNVYF